MTYERFFEYIKYPTQSDEECANCPSTGGQLVFAEYLVKELESVGAEQVKMDEHGYVYAALPATEGLENRPVIGFIAHMDTAPAFSGENIRPRIIPDYDGGDIVLNQEQNIIMQVSEFEHLKDYIGQTIIVTDGTTLLGSDDKAGVAEIIAALDKIKQDKIKHGPVRIAFTPDEEIGRGADLFDVEYFGADYAYTVDGGALGELEYENFNAAKAVIHVTGRSVHPGDAKDKMKNAAVMAMEFHSELPKQACPERTSGYEGFFHLTDMHGSVEAAQLSYIIRDHDREKFEKKKQLVESICSKLNERHGGAFFAAEITDQYYNMKEKIEPYLFLIENVKTCMKKLDIEPHIQPIRGGTDGARLSFMGVPCPNLCAGGHNFHGRYEYCCVESMEKITQLLILLAQK